MSINEKFKELIDKSSNVEQEYIDNISNGGSSDDGDLLSFDWHRLIIDDLITGDNSEFIVNETKYRAYNRLSGRIYNPMGMYLTASKKDETFQAVLDNIDTLFDTSFIDSNDGENFGVVLDNDSMSRFYTASEYSDKEGDAGNILLQLRSLLSPSFINDILSTEATFLKDRSILGQVTAYQHNTENEISDDDQEEFFSNLTEIKGQGSMAVGYALGTDLILRSPVLYLDKISKMTNDELDVSRKAKNNNRELSKSWYRKLSGTIDSISSILNNDNNIDNDGDEVKYFENSRLINKEFYKPDKTGNGSNEINFEILEKNINNISYNTGIKTIVNNLKSGIENLSSNIQELQKKKNNRKSNIFDNTSNKNYVLREIYDKYDHERFETDFGTENDTTDIDKRNSYLYVIKDSQRKIEDFYDEGKSLYKKFEDIEVDDKTKLNDNILMRDISNDAQSENDSFFMSFRDMRTSKKCLLRASIDTLSDDLQATFNPIQYFGRTEPLYTYSDTTRSISFPFILYCGNPKEFYMMYKKLEFLRSMLYPLKENNDFSRLKTPMTHYRIGNMFRNLYGHITSLSTSIDNNTTDWFVTEKSGGQIELQAPKIINCSITLQVVHEKMVVTENIDDERDYFTNIPQYGVHNN